MPADDPKDPAFQEFLRVLAHQLKSPINTIESFLKALSQGLAGSMDDRALYMVEKAIGKTSEARELITDLMIFSQSAQKGEAELEEVDLSDLLRSLATAFHFTAIENNIALTLSLPAATRPVARGRASALNQAIRNLIDNALKYTPPQGKVEIRLTPLPRQEACHISISDTGPGIPAEELPRLFEPFFRSPKLKGQISGTGLGLAIVRQIVLQHKGTVEAQSVEGRGMMFQITLPCSFLPAERESRKKQREVLIIGGVTAGPKVAARLRRLDEDINITIVEKSEFLAYTGSGLPNYIAGQVASPSALLSTAEGTLRDISFFEAIKNIRVRHHSQALEIDRGNRRVRVRDLKTQALYDLSYDVLVLATGAVPALPPIPGVNQEGVYSFYRIEDAEELKEKLAREKAQDVLIIGGGLIGVETSECFTLAGARATILERASYLLGSLVDPDICLRVQHLLNQNGIKTVTGCDVEWIVRKESGLTVKTSSGLHHADFILLSTGVRPNTELAAKAGLELGPSGGIRVNTHLQTSDSRIYAVGDCAESVHQILRSPAYWPLGSVSCKMGRQAADHIARRRSRYEGSLGTALFRIFGTTVARTGLTSEAAAGAGYEVESVVVTGLDHAHFYPDALPVAIKVIADRKSRKVLGAQGIGKGQVAPRIQILAAAIGTSLTLDQVFDLDLGFYPAFNNPIDLSQTACLVLANKLDGLVQTLSWLEFERERESCRLIDVSPAGDFALSGLPGSINIPLENLRIESVPFPSGTPIVLVSKTSSRAYEASRILLGKGFGNCRILEGGILFIRG